MEYGHQVVLLFAGLSFFMYGMLLASENLQKLCTDQIRTLMGKLDNRPLIGVLVGIGMTTLMQSSGAVTVMLVNLAQAGVVTLSQVMGVIVGAAVGATITVQIISFKITEYAAYFVILGFGMLFFSKTKKAKRVSNIVLAIGFVFFGLLVMSHSVSVIKDMPALKESFETISKYPLYAFVGACLFSAFVHSSAVTIGLAMALASNGLISLYEAMFWVYGANLGTTATALMASVSGKYIGRQVAWAHILFKAISVGLFLLLTKWLAELAMMTDTNVVRQIANANTIFNVASACLFLPFIAFGTKLIEHMIPKPFHEEDFKPKYLDNNAIPRPTQAFGYAIREMLRMAEIAVEMVKVSPKVFEKYDPDFLSVIREMDKKLDLLNKEIKHYLVKINSQRLTEAQSQSIVSLIALVSDLEQIGDVIDRGVVGLSGKMRRLKVTFSDEGWNEVQEYHQFVVENFQTAISAFNLQSKELAKQVISNKRDLRVFEVQLKGSHIQRLHENNQESINTSNIHLEVLAAYKSINSYACNLVYPILHAKDHGLFPETKIELVKSEEN